MEVKFEYLGEDQDFEGAKMYRVEAIHVTTTRNKRKFTKTEMELAGRSLSFRPLNINHDESRQLPFPENATLFMEFNPTMMCVEGRFRVLDTATNAMIETHRIKQVSIEQIPTKGEDCNEISCEQHGVAFIGMALLEDDQLPGDPHANIMMESLITNTESISSLIISDGQRTCKECTDFEACHTCKHKVEAGDKCMDDCLSKKKAAGKTIDDQAIAICLSECGQSRKDEAWWWYERIKKRY